MLQFIHVLRMSTANALLQNLSEIFNGIQVWRVSWPLQNLNPIRREPLTYRFGCMSGGQILLENLAIVYSHGDGNLAGQNFLILFCIDSLALINKIKRTPPRI